MKENPLYLAFLWHMHQPYYGDKGTKRYSLPWVRLHGVKDYYPMGLICEEFPALHQNFNFTPCLLEQIDDYVRGEATDSFRDLSVKPASLLSEEDKDAILSNFFLANWERMVRRFPRYEDLLYKRGKYPTRLQDARERFSTQDFLDLQVLFNLSWFHSLILERDEELKALKEKEDFSEEDKEVILRKEREILSSIVPIYKRLQSKGQIEITTSPYYHPILPLLCNTEVAKVGLPDLNLPFRFSHPEDAEEQVKRAVRYQRLVFGSPPCGMWPSEGSVSEDIIPLVARAGIKWIAADEDILSLSLEGAQRTGPYQPYRVQVRGEEVSILFRERTLSDLIGFTYQSWSPKEGAKDLISRLRKIKKEVMDSSEAPLVTIILDGENPWEYYPDNGREFLFTLFEELSKAGDLETVTVSQYLKEHPPKKTLTRLFPGSWINHNFYIWIGHDEDQIAWDLLRQTRDVLVECESEGSFARDKIACAWEEIYIAEGSDWCWWYGAAHSSLLEEEFDILYREHLANVYRLLEKEVPANLSSPITQRRRVEPEEEPVGLIHPILDGLVSNYYEWKPAGVYRIGKVGGTMHRAHSILERIYYGFDLKNVYLRIDPRVDFKEMREVRLKIEISSSKRLILELAPLHFPKEEELTVYAPGKEGKWVKESSEAKWAFGQIMELALPFKEIGAKEGKEVSFFIGVWSKGKEVERWPKRRRITFLVPGPDYESTQWYV